MQSTFSAKKQETHIGEQTRRLMAKGIFVITNT